MDVLKHEAIDQFNQLLKKLHRGYLPEYKFLLDLISFINLDEHNESVEQYFINAKGFLHYGK